MASCIRFDSVWGDSQRLGAEWSIRKRFKTQNMFFFLFAGSECSISRMFNTQNFQYAEYSIRRRDRFGANWLWQTDNRYTNDPPLKRVVRLSAQSACFPKRIMLLLKHYANLEFIIPKKTILYIADAIKHFYCFGSNLE